MILLFAMKNEGITHRQEKTLILTINELGNTFTCLNK